VKKFDVVTFTGVAGYFLAAFAGFGIALALSTPDQRDGAFWLRLAWTEFLILLVYLPLFSFFRAVVNPARGPKPLIGVLPAAEIVVLIYGFASFVLMWLNATSTVPNSWHLALQIALGFLAGTIFTLMNVAHSSASIGLGKKFAPSASPAELSVRLFAAESMVKVSAPKDSGVPLVNGIKRLGEVVKYSLSHVSKPSLSEQYQEFAEQVQSFCAEVELVSGSVSPDRLTDLMERSQLLLTKAQSLSKLTVSR
jgi:hypothetical protein